MSNDFNAADLWNQHKESLTDDIKRQHPEEGIDTVFQMGLHKIRIAFLEISNMSRFLQLGLPIDPLFNTPDNDPEHAATPIDIVDPSLNDEQLEVYDTVLRRVQQTNGPYMWYLDGVGGTGKTYLYNAIIDQLHNSNKKVLSASWTGISALLLKNGTTYNTGW